MLDTDTEEFLFIDEHDFPCGQRNRINGLALKMSDRYSLAVCELERSISPNY